MVALNCHFIQAALEHCRVRWFVGVGLVEYTSHRSLGGADN